MRASRCVGGKGQEGAAPLDKALTGRNALAGFTGLDGCTTMIIPAGERTLTLWSALLGVHYVPVTGPTCNIAVVLEECGTALELPPSLTPSITIGTLVSGRGVTTRNALKELQVSPGVFRLPPLPAGEHAMDLLDGATGNRLATLELSNDVHIQDHTYTVITGGTTQPSLLRLTQ